MTSDINTVFCTSQSVFGAGTLVGSTDWVDMKVAQDNAGGQGPVLEIVVTKAFAGGVGAKFRIAACDSSGNNPAILDQTGDISVSDLVVGARFLLRMSPQPELPSAALTHLRAYALNNGTNTAGAVTMHLIPEGASDQRGKAYASGW